MMHMSQHPINFTRLRKPLGVCFQHVDVQRQIGSPAADCGLLSIAFSICICNKLDPHTVGFDQSKMRSHYVACIERERFTQFPATSKPRRPRSRYIYTKDVRIYCTCRCPWDKKDVVKGPLVQCKSCKELYHMMCCNINIDVVNSLG